MSLKDELKLGDGIKITKKTIIHLMFTGDYILNEINSTLKPYQLSNQQYNVLRILRGQRGKTMSLEDIQSRMIHKNSNTTRLINKLMMKEFVTREVDENNRRKVKIAISKEGLAILKELDPIIDNLESQMLNRLKNDDLEQLNQALEKLRIN